LSLEACANSAIRATSNNTGRVKWQCGNSGCDSDDDYAIFNHSWKHLQTLESEYQHEAESPVQSLEPEQPQASVDALSESVIINIYVEPWDFDGFLPSLPAIVEEGDKNEEVEEEEDHRIISVFKESDLHKLEEEEGITENPVVLCQSSQIASLPMVSYKESLYRPHKCRKKKCTL
jgi:hypothetical protein